MTGVVTPNVETVYVCTDCGKMSANINTLDLTCQDNAQLCYKSSLQMRGERVALARAVETPGAEL